MLARKFALRCLSLKSRHSSRSCSGGPPKKEQNEKDEEERISELLRDAASFNESTDKTWGTTPYPQDAPSTPENMLGLEKPKLDPLDFSILMFPGQGSLKVGAISEYMKFPRVKELYDTANQVLGYDLAKLCLQGPQKRLDRTEFNQPATIVASLAALERLWEERPRAIESCKGVIGYSVGEITALVFSGAIEIEDAIRLAAVRGAAMQQASEKVPQGMLVVYCTPSAKIHKTCEEAKNWARDLGVESPVCQVAVYLYTQCKILAGNEEALNYIEQNAQTQGLRILKRLPVSGAFHTPLMEPAIQSFYKAIENVDLHIPRVPVYSNVKVKPHRSTRDVAKYLVKQIVSPVKWQQIIQFIYERPADTAFPRTFDLGSAGTMRNILIKNNAKAADHCLSL